MSVSDRIDDSAFGEAILAVLSECLELVIPGAERRIGGDDQAVCDEPIDDVEQLLVPRLLENP